LVRKKPSSLDYEALLHELALRNWRIALLAGDFPRALGNADRLARSTDRFWSWQGRLDVATTHLAAGAAAPALEALESAKSLYSDVPALQAPAFELHAHVLVESGRLVEALELPGPDSELFLFHRGVAAARLSGRDEAREVADRLACDPLAFSIVRGEALIAGRKPRDAIDLLRAALSEESRLPALRVPALAALGRALVDARELEPARDAFTAVDDVPDGLVHWPAVWVRSYYFRGEILLELADRDAAVRSLETFLRFWKMGELDRERIERATQLVMA
jgi:tetratricopeptide (TPR) repeat protein